MVNNMAKNIGHLISLNGEYMYSAAHGEMYAPLRVNEHNAQKLQKALETKKPDEKSCVQTIATTWCDGKFMIGVSFKKSIKCPVNFTRDPSPQAKSEVCSRNMCNGRCIDTFMRNVVAKNILPELYTTKQK